MLWMYCQVACSQCPRLAKRFLPVADIAVRKLRERLLLDALSLGDLAVRNARGELPAGCRPRAVA